MVDASLRRRHLFLIFPAMLPDSYTVNGWTFTSPETTFCRPSDSPDLICLLALTSMLHSGDVTAGKTAATLIVAMKSHVPSDYLILISSPVFPFMGNYEDNKDPPMEHSGDNKNGSMPTLLNVAMKPVKLSYSFSLSNSPISPLMEHSR